MNIEKIGNMLLPAIAYGDAAGLPFEAQTAEAITQSTPGLNRLHAPVDHPYFGRGNQAGTTSDDTQLSVAVAKALLESDGFCMRTIVSRHLEAYEATPREFNSKGTLTARGWGGSTVESMERLKGGVSPRESGAKGGAGNGVVMKMAPLVLWQVARQVSAEQRSKQYDDLTVLTHASDVAKVCSRVHGDVLHDLLTRDGEFSDVVDVAAESASKHERLLNEPDAVLSKLLGAVALKKLTPKIIMDACLKAGFYAPETLVMAYGAYKMYQPDFAKTVYGAVGLGGDTDSVASVVAAMIVFSNPDLTLPNDLGIVEGINGLSRLSKEFTRKALREEF